MKRDRKALLPGELVRQVVEVPAKIDRSPGEDNLDAAYGVTRTVDAAPLTIDFINFLLGREGQSILARHGSAPA